MIATGIRDLKNNLSRYIRQVETDGARIVVTDHGRVVAELGPPSKGAITPTLSRYDALVASGGARLPVESGDPLENWPKIKLARGTVKSLIDEDRGDR